MQLILPRRTIHIHLSISFESSPDGPLHGRQPLQWFIKTGLQQLPQSVQRIIYKKDRGRQDKYLFTKLSRRDQLPERSHRHVRIHIVNFFAAIGLILSTYLLRWQHPFSTNVTASFPEHVQQPLNHAHLQVDTPYQSALIF